jgi:hypothetical protein
MVLLGVLEAVPVFEMDYQLAVQGGQMPKVMLVGQMQGPLRNMVVAAVADTGQLVLPVLD